MHGAAREAARTRSACSWSAFTETRSGRPRSLERVGFEARHRDKRILAQTTHRRHIDMRWPGATSARAGWGGRGRAAMPLPERGGEPAHVARASLKANGAGKSHGLKCATNASRAARKRADHPNSRSKAWLHGRQAVSTGAERERQRNPRAKRAKFCAALQRRSGTPPGL